MRGPLDRVRLKLQVDIRGIPPHGA